jgi:hypothetical protein
MDGLQVRNSAQAQLCSQGMLPPRESRSHYRAFYLIGANDVANAFGTSVSSCPEPKCFSLRLAGTRNCESAPGTLPVK